MLKRRQFWWGGRGRNIVEWNNGIKKVFHLIHKENIKKIKEVLRKPGSCDSQFRSCETVCFKILHWEVAGTVQKIIQNWKKVILKILEILWNYYRIECRERIAALRTMFRMPHGCLIFYFILDFFCGISRQTAMLISYDFYVLQHDWYMQNNSVAVLFSTDHMEIYVLIKTASQGR